MLDCDLASKGPFHQLKSSYNSPFKDSYSHLIHACFAMIASNGFIFLYLPWHFFFFILIIN